RRIEYWPVSGRARQALLTGDPGFATPAAPPPPPPTSGAVEFF
ncbi:hypothetical protein M2281_004664, partial [Mesorhizobium soli]|nr:hypothetical protein [Mesorhizobium soli]